MIPCAPWAQIFHMFGVTLFRSKFSSWIHVLPTNFDPNCCRSYSYNRWAVSGSMFFRCVALRCSKSCSYNRKTTKKHKSRSIGQYFFNTKTWWKCVGIFVFFSNCLADSILAFGVLKYFFFSLPNQDGLKLKLFWVGQISSTSSTKLRATSCRRIWWKAASSAANKLFTASVGRVLKKHLRSGWYRIHVACMKRYMMKLPYNLCHFPI